MDQFKFSYTFSYSIGQFKVSFFSEYGLRERIKTSFTIYNTIYLFINDILLLIISLFIDIILFILLKKSNQEHLKNLKNILKMNQIN